jgi:uncharacterized protein
MEVLISQLSEEVLKSRRVHEWPIWEKEESEFDWYYDQEEHCLLLEGEVELTTDTGHYHFAAGDYVVFAQGLKCRWTIRQAVRKHYCFF